MVEITEDVGVSFTTGTEKDTVTEAGADLVAKAGIDLVVATSIIIAGTGADLVAEIELDLIAKAGVDLAAETGITIIGAGTETGPVAETGACRIMAGIKSNTTASTEISTVMPGTSFVGGTGTNTEIAMTAEAGLTLVELNRTDVVGEIALLLVGAGLARDQEIHVEGGEAKVTLDQKGAVTGIILVSLMVQQTLAKAPTVVESAQKQEALVKAATRPRNTLWRQPGHPLLIPNRTRLLS